MPQSHFVTHKSHMDWPVVSNPGLCISGMILVGKLAYSEKDLSWRHSITRKFHMDWPEI
jgi:hypothetical protein